MRILYSDQNPLSQDEPALFLAGPTPRHSNVASWRPEALECLDQLQFSHTVCVPEPRLPTENFDYQSQVDWEFACLHHCSVIAFWIPRSILRGLPGFTTNVEFGYWLAKDPSKVLYGRPPNADKIQYLDWMYQKTARQPIYSDLRELMVAAFFRFDRS